MPLDSNMGCNVLDPFRRRAVWYKKFAWWPSRCMLSHRVIWLTIGYKGTAMWTGPGSPVFEHHWISKEEFLFAKFKGQL